MTGIRSTSPKINMVDTENDDIPRTTSAKSVSLLKDILFPVTKVPVNYALESASYAPLIGGIRAYKRMFEKNAHQIKAEDADLIIKLMSRQMVGIGLYALGMVMSDYLGGHRDYSKLFESTEDGETKFEEIDNYVKVASINDIAENDYNLNIPLYVEKVIEDNLPTVEEALNELKTAWNESLLAEEKFKKILKEFI